MSNEKECGCKYLETDPNEVARFTDRTRIEEIIRKIPLLFNENMFAKVVRLAVLLPPKKNEIEEILESNAAVFNLNMSEIKAEHAKNLYNTMIAIEASYSLLIRKKPYEPKYFNGQKIDIIEDLARLTLSAKEGKECWEKELFNALLEDGELNKSIEVWNENLDSIKKLIKLFHLPAEEIKGICEKAINKSKETKPFACMSVAGNMDICINLQEYLGIADEIMRAANEDNDKKSRHEKVREACLAYKALQEEHGYFDREKILKKRKEYKMQEAIREASKILGFKYIGRFWQEAGSCH